MILRAERNPAEAVEGGPSEMALLAWDGDYPVVCSKVDDARLLVSTERATRRWIREHGLDGYDPIDYMDTALFRFLLHRSTQRGFRYAERLCRLPLVFAPRLSRRCLGVHKRCTSAGVAAVLRGLLSERTVTRSTAAHDDADHPLMSRLCEQQASAGQGAGWGLPYAWPQPGGDHWPPRLPNAHTTVRVVGTLLDRKDKLDESSVDATIRGALRFLQKDLTWTDEGGGRLACSYTPGGREEVINVFAHVAGTLARAARSFPAEVELGRALALADSALDAQMPDGLWAYDRGPTSWRNGPDVYHNAMILEGLAWCCTADSSFRERARGSITRALDTYLAVFASAKKGLATIPGDFRTFDIAGITDGALMWEALLAAELLSYVAVRKRWGAWLRSVSAALRRHRYRNGILPGRVLWPGVRQDYQSLRWGHGTLWASLWIIAELQREHDL
jgi:hypothetical protein